MQKYYYKVLKKDRTSYSVSARHLVLHYPKGSKVVPRIGKIFIFGDKRSARQYAGCDSDAIIVKCTALNPVPQTFSSLFLWDTEKNSTVKRFWKTIEIGEVPRDGGSLPVPGSYVADSIMCME